MYQEGFYRALRVAAYTGLGGGFGFSIGNFIQTTGTLSGVSYNWWNVMEFTLGFCGGLSMAYAIVTSQWPEAAKPSRIANWISLVFLTWLLPWANYVNAFEGEKLMRLAKSFGIEDAKQFAFNQQVLGLGILLVIAIGSCINWKCHEKRNDKSLFRLGSFVLFAYTLYYVIYGFIVKGFFYRSLSIGSSDTMYLPILFLAAVLFLISGRGQVEAAFSKEGKSLGLSFFILAALVVGSIVTVTAATQLMHDGKMSFHERFPVHEDVNAASSRP
jgi:hypothetical protein